MFVRNFILLFISVLSTNLGSTSYAINFKSLSCAPPNQQAAQVPSVTVSCTAIIERTGSGGWYNAPWQECSSYCRAIAAVNVPSPDGFSCTSGEERPRSAIGVINYAPTGCWHNCRSPEGRRGAISVGHRCYAPGQKRDNDRTDTTVGCFCATGDVHSHVVDIGIHASGNAQITGAAHNVEGWTSVHKAVLNDQPGRISYIRGAIPLSTKAAVHFVVNITGACGAQVAMSGRTNGSGGTTDRSNEVIINLPACKSTCSDGVDNDYDGSIDTEDFSCVASKGDSEHLPQAACENGLDDDGDGAYDEEDPGCSGSQDDNEGGSPSSCEPAVEASDDLKSLEDTIRAQRVVLYELLDPIIKNASDPKVKERAQELRDMADTVKRDLVRNIYRKYPSSTLQCPACPTQDLTEIKNGFVVQSRRMQRLTRQVAAFARFLTPGLNVRTSLQTADSLFVRFKEIIAGLPNRTSLCPK